MFLIADCLLSQSSVKAAAHISWVIGFCKSWKGQTTPFWVPRHIPSSLKHANSLDQLVKHEADAPGSGFGVPSLLVGSHGLNIFRSPRKHRSHLFLLGEACRCVCWSTPAFVPFRGLLLRLRRCLRVKDIQSSHHSRGLAVGGSVCRSTTPSASGKKSLKIGVRTLTRSGLWPFSDLKDCWGATF